MPHDHHDHHDHHHPAPPRGHNRGGPDPLASHLHGPDAAEEVKVLSAQFIEGFREARDKSAYLRLAGVPFELEDGDGGPPLKLVDVEIVSGWQVAAASPGFGTRELAWLPFPGERIQERTNMGFVYVSLDAKRTLDLRAFLAGRFAPG
jgi:hypothetical protein